MSREYVKLGSLDYPLAGNHITFFAYETALCDRYITASVYIVAAGKAKCWRKAANTGTHNRSRI